MPGKDMELAIKIKGKVDPSFNSAMSSIGNGIKGATKVIGTATLAAAAAVAGIATAAVKVGKEFESSMSQVSATMALDTSTAEGQEAYQQLEDAARECGRTTAYSATEAAEGLNYLALAGYDATQAADALPVVLQLAGAGAMDLAEASDLVTDAMSALNMEATQENLTTFSDQLAAGASNANASVSQLGEAIIKVGGTASNLSGGTAELNTALGILANNGIKGAQGGTHLRNMILSLQNPTSAAAAEMQNLGVEVYDAEGNMNSLQEIFGTMQESMEGWTDEEVSNVMSTIFNKTDLASAQAMLAGCTDEWDNLYDAIENSAGACEDMYNTQLDNLNGDIDILKSALSDLGISIYEDLKDGLRGVTQEATDMVLQLSDAYAEGGLEGMISEVGNVVAELATDIASAAPDLVQTAMSMIGSFLEGISASAPQIMNAAIETVTTFISGLGTLLPQLLTCGVSLVTSLLEGIAQGLPQIIMSGLQMIQGLVQGIVSNIPTLIQSGVQIIVSLIQGMSSNYGNIASTAIQIITELANGLISAIPVLISAIPQIIGALVDAILNTNWLEMGVQIITSIGQGIISAVGNLGSSIMGAIKGLFGGGSSDAEAQSSGAEVTESYASGIESNTGAVESAASNVNSAFGNMDTSEVSAAGQASAEAYTDGMDEALSGYEMDTSSMGMDSTALTENMSQAATESGQAFTEGLDNSISSYNMDTSSIGVDTATLSGSMSEAGSTSGQALTDGLNSAVAATTVDTSSIAVDSSGIVSSMQQAGVEGGQALATGIQSGGASASSAATSLMQSISQAFTSGWNTIRSSAQSAMNTLTSTVKSGAQAGANAVKAAYSNVRITIPKPRIPVISVSTSSVSYGDGGSVSIPKFSVSWNALGGIIDDPTIFGSAQGLQGVGEAGPEAITPLDEMWEQIRQIVTDVIQGNSGSSAVDTIMNKLEGITSGGGNTEAGSTYEMAGAGGPTITYSPTYNLNGTATKQDAVEAEKISQEEFARMMKDWEKNNARTKF